MKTSCFLLKGNDPNAISISRKRPSWYQGKHYEPLAPPLDLVERYVCGLIDASQYEKEYKDRILSNLDPFQVFVDLGQDAILLCNAPPGKFCHRKVGASWLGSALNIQILELSDN
jgi:hypothetical protein